MRDRLALDGGPYNLFDSSSRIAATSSICSASNMHTALSLGLTVPPEILSRAVRIIN
jgi:hypothetical protein